MLYVDALASFWRDWVVNYDAGHQQALAVEAKSGSRHLQRAVRRWWRSHYETLLEAVRRTEKGMVRSPLRWGLVGLLIATGLLFVFYGRRFLQALAKRRVAARPEKNPRQAATIWYARMTEIIARRGWRKAAAQTPSEFVSGIDDTAVRGKVAQFTRCYESARFDESAEDARRLPDLYQEISADRHR